MKCKTSAVRSTLGWLLLTACVILAVSAVITGYKPVETLHYEAALRCVPVEEIPVQTGDVPVNTADADALDELPGVGEATAQAIIAERECSGPFYYPEDLMHVKGIGEKKLEGMRDKLDLTEETP